MPHVETSDGLKLAYYTWGDEPGRPLVILQHGFTAHARQRWEPSGLPRALADAGFRVAALDARGHGRSDKPHDPARYPYPRMAKDVSELADHLGAESYHLVGYSMGGYIALHAAAADPRIRRLAIGGISAALAETPDPARSEAIAAALEAADVETIPAAMKPFRLSAQSEGNDIKALAAVVRGNARSPRGKSLLAAKIPTLAFAGADDRLAHDIADFADKMPNARAVTLTGDHRTVYEDPLFCSELVEFLSAA